MPRKTKKQIIYEVAAECFRQKGYTASSMREIAERVGIEPSSLYSHIKSKEEILISVCMDCADSYHRNLDGITKEESDPIIQLTRLIEMHIDMALQSPSSITAFTDEWKHLPDDHKKVFIASRKAYEEKVTLILNNGIACGQLRKITPETALNSMLSTLRWVHFKHSLEDPKAVNKLKEELCQFILGGLKV